MQAFKGQCRLLAGVGGLVIRLRVLDILKKKNKTKYWLFMQMNMSYQNFNKI